MYFIDSVFFFILFVRVYTFLCFVYIVCIVFIIVVLLVYFLMKSDEIRCAVYETLLKQFAIVSETFYPLHPACRRCLE